MSRLFTAENAAGAAVADVEARLFFQSVMSVDVDAGEIELVHQPLRMVGNEIVTYKVRYRSIYPIYAGQMRPVLFHCYGRQA